MLLTDVRTSTYPMYVFPLKWTINKTHPQIKREEEAKLPPAPKPNKPNAADPLIFPKSGYPNLNS